MATISPNGGVNETEPTLIGDDQLQNVTGAEYRVGEAGLFVARGRDLFGTLTGATGKGLYELGFDGTSQYVLAHVGNSYHVGRIPGILGETLSFTLIDNLGSDTLPVVGAHYANRHYTANAVQNRRLEGTTFSAGVTSFPIGMSATTVTLGTSLSGSSTGSIDATTGLEYWVTEYDSARGIESVFGNTVHTGAFSSRASVTVSISGSTAAVNARADKWRWYRSTDGGATPTAG